MPRVEPAQVPPQEEPSNVRKEVRKVVPDPDKVKEMIAKMEEQARLETVVKDPVSAHKNIVKLDPSSESFKYSIDYIPLCAGKVAGIPDKLRYRPIDGITIATINEMNVNELDDMINFVLDTLCFESKFEGFTHWLMPNPEKIRAYLNLRINTVGETIETLSGFCNECGKPKAILKVNILDFDEKDLNERYKEPFPLKYKTRIKEDGKFIEKEVKFTSRLIQSGDMKKARTIYDKDKKFIAEYFPGLDSSKKDVMIQIIEYANTILSFEGQGLKFEDAVIKCRDSAQLVDAITSFNNYFNFGMVLEKEDVCDNPECTSAEKKEVEVIDKSSRRVLPEEGTSWKTTSTFSVPIQPALFYILEAPERSVEFFDDNQEGSGVQS